MCASWRGAPSTARCRAWTISCSAGWPSTPPWNRPGPSPCPTAACSTSPRPTRGRSTASSRSPPTARWPSSPGRPPTATARSTPTATASQVRTALFFPAWYPLGCSDKAAAQQSNKGRDRQAVIEFPWEAQNLISRSLRI